VSFDLWESIFDPKASMTPPIIIGKSGVTPDDELMFDEDSSLFFETVLVSS